MKAAIGVIGVLLVGLATYFFVARTSSEDHLEELLHHLLEPDAVVSLNRCDLFIVIDVVGTDGEPVALNRVVMRADLRNYDFETVQLVPRSDKVTLRVNRKPVTNAMLDQATDIVDVVGEGMANLLPDREGIRDLLSAEDGSLFFRVMAEVETSDGKSILIAHEDAPDFFEFSQSVEAFAPPASYQSTTTYTLGGPSADTLLTGHVMAVPLLQFTLISEDQAKELGQAFYNHVVSSGCD